MWALAINGSFGFIMMISKGFASYLNNSLLTIHSLLCKHFRCVVYDTRMKPLTTRFSVHSG